MIYVAGYEGTSPCLTGTLLDDEGAAINPASVSSVLFTLYDRTVPTRDIINARNSAQVLYGAPTSTNEFRISAQGVFSFVFTADDMKIVHPAKDTETHQFDFQIAYLDSLSRNRIAVITGQIVVENRRAVS